MHREIVLCVVLVLLVKCRTYTIISLSITELIDQAKYTTIVIISWQPVWPEAKEWTVSSDAATDLKTT